MRTVEILDTPSVEPRLHQEDLSTFSVKVVECEIDSAAERWRELIRFLLEVEATQ